MVLPSRFHLRRWNVLFDSFFTHRAILNNISSLRAYVIYVLDSLGGFLLIRIRSIFDRIGKKCLTKFYFCLFLAPTLIFHFFSK